MTYFMLMALQLGKVKLLAHEINKTRRRRRNSSKALKPKRKFNHPRKLNMANQS